MTPPWEILVGDCREVLATLPEESVHTVVTSPPYFGLRDYGTGEWEGGDPVCDHVKGELRKGVNLAQSAHTTRGGAKKIAEVGTVQFGDVCGKCGATRADRQIGLEPTPEEFVQALVEVFREVRRVLRDDGTVWLNLGDTYATRWSSIRTDGGRAGLGPGDDRARHHAPPTGFKNKDLIGVPWMVAFALRADGWYLRRDIIWAKKNCMPESVIDRPTSSHEFIFLLSKSERYFYDADAIREPDKGNDHPRTVLAGQPSLEPSGGVSAPHRGLRTVEGRDGRGANKRDVWHVALSPYPGAHFATFPPDLIEPCVLAGAPEKACSSCGAPWQRLVERGASTWDARKAAGATWGNVENPASGGGTQRVVHGEGMSRDLTPGASRTVGFEPSCDCGAPPARGVVLDPFSGAGTSGMVAVRNGRGYVGVELNEEYAQMARDRIATDIRLGHRAPRRAREQSSDQVVLDLFG